MQRQRRIPANVGDRGQFISSLTLFHAGNGSSDAGVSSYRDGFSDCAREVATYLGQLDSPGGVLVRTRVLAHLSARLRAVNSTHRRQQATPTASQLLPVPVPASVDAVTSSLCRPAAASSTSDVRVAAPVATRTCSTDTKLHSPDGASIQRPSTPLDQKPHVTTTVMTSPAYDVNGNDVATCRGSVHRRSTPAAAVADDEQNASPVWRPW